MVALGHAMVQPRKCLSLFYTRWIWLARCCLHGKRRSTPWLILSWVPWIQSTALTTIPHLDSSMQALYDSILALCISVNFPGSKIPDWYGPDSTEAALLPSFEYASQFLEYQKCGGKWRLIWTTCWSQNDYPWGKRYSLGWIAEHFHPLPRFSETNKSWKGAPYRPFPSDSTWMCTSQFGRHSSFDNYACTFDTWLRRHHIHALHHRNQSTDQKTPRHTP